MLTVSLWTSTSESFPDLSSVLPLGDFHRLMFWVDLDQRRRQDLDLRFQSGVLRRSSSVGDVAIRWLAAERQSFSSPAVSSLSTVYLLNLFTLAHITLSTPYFDLGSS
jgi:hypothetical protein